MIDITAERLLTMSQAARLRPPTRGGRPTHPSTVYRWIARGVRGRRLEAIRLGSTLYTSAEAVQRFADGLTATDVVPHGTITLTRQRAAKAADAELERLGF